MWSRDEQWVYDDVTKRMVKRKLSVCPALLKIFDEILVNAADNFHRQANTTSIDITAEITKDEGLIISVFNDGNTIPIEKHGDEQIFVPELIFGHLLTGSNFDDSTERLTGGSHGYGAKVCNIFSRNFSIDIYDSDRKLHYRQEWSENMKQVSPAVISTNPPLLSSNNANAVKEQMKHSYTMIRFQPDLKRFHLGDNLEEHMEKFHDIIEMYCRRAFDVAACLNGAVKVSFNGMTVPILSFEDYCKLFQESSQFINLSSGVTNNVIHVGDRWTVALLPSPSNTFESMSFVNSVWTGKGGSHVNVMLNQIIPTLESMLLKNKISASTSSIKNSIMLLVNCRIPNPSFEGQTKDSLLTTSGNFGCSYSIPQKALKAMIENSRVVDRIIADFKELEQSRLESLTGANKVTKRKMLLDVPKLEDAHYAGTGNALDCTLILTEGDSAKALAVAGLSVVGRDFFGVMPLRGKLLNVKAATKHQISHNEEISHLCKALGLDFSKSYANGLQGENLRYGKIMLMCDQDHDGSHIKGLIINFLHRFWPNLLKLEGFVQVFVTPIVKVRDNKGKLLQSFFSLFDYHQWLVENDFDNESSTIVVVNRENQQAKSTEKRKKIFVKYYKGLGTSTAEEGKEYFANIDLHKKIFVPTIMNNGEEGDIDDQAIDLLFSKDRSRERKDWLSRNYSPSLQLNLSSSDKVSFKDFIEKELIHFSFSDNWRSIPSVIDGLKPSQRKVLYGCFHRFQSHTQESKLVQLAGYIAEKSAYHHGEASLHSTLINMAQSFVGSNNLPIIEGVGQFGTRFKGGQDHASPRYIFAKLSPLARKIFCKDDDDLLQYLEEDGILVEPKWFLPIIPFILVNGCQGIGTGWSTKIPAYNPLDLIDAVEEKLVSGQVKKKLIPWYRGFKGSITPMLGNKEHASLDFMSSGIAKRINKTTIEVTELPIEKWTEDYKEYLHKLIENGDIKGFKEFHGTEDVRFIITAPKATLDKMESDGLVQSMKLNASINISNMHAFSQDDCIKRFVSPEQMLEEYFPVRLDAYEQRKNKLMQKLHQDAMITENRSRFVEEIVSGRLDLYSISSTSDDAIAAEMNRRGFICFSKIHGMASGDSGQRDFGYLLNMPLHSLSSHQVQSLRKQLEESRAKLQNLSRTTSSSLWSADLDLLRQAYLKYSHSRENEF
jgi:DNA topoisomerase-2